MASVGNAPPFLSAKSWNARASCLRLLAPRKRSTAELFTNTGFLISSLPTVTMVGDSPSMWVIAVVVHQFADVAAHLASDVAAEVVPVHLTVLVLRLAVERLDGEVEEDAVTLLAQVVRLVGDLTLAAREQR